MGTQWADEGRGDPDRARRHYAAPSGGYRARRENGLRWEDLAARALASPLPPYRPVPGTAVYHLSVDDRLVQVGEYDLDGPLRDLVTVVLAMGAEP